MHCEPCESSIAPLGGGWSDAYITHCRDRPELEPGHPVHPKGRKFQAGRHATWKRSTNAAHCVRCHQTFGSPGASARHNEAGEGRCRDAETVGLAGTTNRYGTVIWRGSA